MVNIKKINSIIGYKDIRDCYYITTCGRVISTWKNNTKFLSIALNSYGYGVVSLYKTNGKRKVAKVHRLVALAYINNKYNKQQVNHKNEIKTENYVGNLEWATPKENCNWGTRNTRTSIALKGKYIGEKSSFYGKHHTKEAKAKIAESKRGNKNYKAKQKEYYEVNAVRRDVFRVTCRRQGWNFEDFKEVFAYHYRKPSGISVRMYNYISVERND